MKFIRPDSAFAPECDVNDRKAIDRSRYTAPASEIALLEAAQRRARNRQCERNDTRMTEVERTAIDDNGVRLERRHAHALSEQRQQAAPGFRLLSGMQVGASAAGETCACGAPVDEDGRFAGDVPEDWPLTCEACGAPLRHCGADTDDVSADEHVGDADVLDDELSDEDVTALAERFGQVECRGCGVWWALREHAIPRQCPDPTCGAPWSIRDVRLSDEARRALAAFERRNRARSREPEL